MGNRVVRLLTVASATIGAALAGQPAMSQTCLDHVQDFPYSPSDCTAQPEIDRVFRMQTITWKGTDYLFVDEGNEIAVFDIDDPHSPLDVTTSAFGIPNVGDSDYDLLNFSVCDDCRWGIASYKAGTVLFDLGTGTTPSFVGHTFNSAAAIVKGGYTFSVGLQQYLVAATLGSDPCPANASGLYRFNDIDELFNPRIQCLDNGSTGPQIANGLRVEATNPQVFYMSEQFDLFRIYRWNVANEELDYLGTGGIDRANMFRGYGASVDEAAGLLAVADGGDLEIYDVGYGSGTPAAPQLLSTTALFGLDNANAVAVQYPVVHVAQQYSSTTPQTFDVSDPANPVPLDPSFWDPSQPWNNLGACVWNNQALFSDDGTALYLSRYSVLQVIGSGGCLVPVADLSIDPQPAFPGDLVTVVNASTGGQRYATWITDGPSPHGSTILAGTSSLGSGSTLGYTLPPAVAAGDVFFAHAAVETDVYPYDPGGSTPTQIETRQVAIDRTPEAAITITPDTAITGDTVTLSAVAEGQPAVPGGGDPYGWVVSGPSSSTPYTGNPVGGVVLDESGQWTFDLTVQYLHDAPGQPGVPYQASAQLVRQISTVAADFTVAPERPMHNEVITLSSTSAAQSVASLSFDWDVLSSGGGGLVDELAFCDGPGPVDDQCVMPAETLTWGIYDFRLTLTNTVNGDQDVAVVEDVVVVDGTPLTGLVWAPTDPEIGETVVFTITGHSGDLRAEWDFGEPGCPGNPQLQICEPTVTDCHSIAFEFAAGGDKTVTVTVEDPITGAALGAASETVTVQGTGSCDGCIYSLYPLSSRFSSSGGSTTFSVFAQTGCAWTSSTVYPWINITSGASGMGTGSVSFEVAPHSGSDRTGVIEVEGQIHIVEQLGTPVPGDSDLWTSHSGPTVISAGTPFRVTVGYGNHGPGTAESAYVNSYFTAPMGLDVFVDDTVNGSGAMFDALQGSAEGTDTLGNAPLLFWDSTFCEDILFQLQRSDDDQGADPVEGLEPGASATFSYEVTLPTTSPNLGNVTITEPASLAQTWTPNTTSMLNAADKNAYARGACERFVGLPEDDVCEHIEDNCFGARVSQLDAAIEAEFELVNDGSADPTLACNQLQGFTPGNIALLRRGICEFGDKVFHAEQAGAVAVFMVNDGRCGDFVTSDQCAFNMAQGALGGLATIPVVQVAQADGEPVIAAVEGGATVRGVFGGSSQFRAEGTVFLIDHGEEDPDESNNDSLWSQGLGIVGCTYDITPAAHDVGPNGGARTVDVVAGPGCEWSAHESVPWLSITSGASGTGSGTVTYQADANPGGARSAVALIAGLAHSVHQAELGACSSGQVPDDGTAENGYGWGAGDVFVQRFTPPSYPWVLTDVCAAFTQAGGDSTLSFDVVVFSENGPGGGPHDLLATVPATAYGVPSWLDRIFASVSLGDDAVTIEEGSVYVGVAWDSSSEVGFYVAADESPGTPAQIGYYAGPTMPWQPISVVFSGYRSLMIRSDGFAAGDGDWRLAVGAALGGGNGFGDGANQAASAIATLDGSLFVGTENEFGGEVHVTDDGATWVLDNSPGFGDATNDAVSVLVPFDGRLYAATANPVLGAEVWRTDGPRGSWTMVADEGFGDPDNVAVRSGVVFDGYLYLGTEHPLGCELWRSPDGAAWSQVHGNGLGDPANRVADAMAAFRGELYLAIENVNGAELWRSPDGVVWFPVVEDGFGSADNDAVTDLVVFDGALYAGVTNPTTGVQIWRSADGTAFEQVVGDGFGDPVRGEFGSFAVGDVGLLATASGPSTPGIVMESSDGATWTASSSPGFASSDNTAIAPLQYSGDRVWAGTSNEADGCEVWKSGRHPLFEDGFETGDTSAWSPMGP